MASRNAITFHIEDEVCELLIRMCQFAAYIRGRLDKASLLKEYRKADSHPMNNTKYLQKYFDMVRAELRKRISENF